MSFMNPVDMVEEDAADLQFPKVLPSHKKCKQKIIKVQARTDTPYKISYYNLEEFNRMLEQTLDRKSNEETYEKLCDVCFRSLQEPYIKCADCDTELCLECFACGRETQLHRNNHSYIIQKDDIQIFPGSVGWTARDERNLLNTLRTQGYGNWDAVVKALNNKFSASECRKHYHDNFFGGIFERLLNLQHHTQSYMSEIMPYIVKMRSVDPPRHDDNVSMQFKLMAGYRCARGDFNTTYDVTAESFLTTILEYDTNLRDILDESDPDLQIIQDLKCSLVRGYNNRLRERQRRFKVMKDHGLIMANRSMAWMTKYADALRSEVNCKRFLAFMQLCSPIKFDLLLEGLQYFTDVQKTIFRFYELRQNGVRSIIGGSMYFKLKKKRLQNQREQSKTERSSYNFDWRNLIPTNNMTNEAAVPCFVQPLCMPRKKAAPIDIFGLPGFAKLSEDERQLCSVARIMPQSFLDYKNMLIAENTKIGHLRLADARRLVKIDVNKTRQIYDFLIDHGHINKPN